MKSTAFAVLAASLGLATCNAKGQPDFSPSPPVTATAEPVHAPVTPPVTPPSAGARTEDEQNSIDVFRAAAPATVFVAQNQVVLDRWSMRALEVPAGSGTGFIWDERGHIVTNYHVVDGARSLSVTLHDQSNWPAKFVGGDPRKDVAVLRIEAPKEKLVAIRVAEPGYTLDVGQKTVAIGNPFGLDHTLTTGVVSALGREVKGYGNVNIRGMIQTDASINPGNSGGPLLDSGGRLIGMNTMIFSQSGSSAGIGFAVPIDTVRRVVEQIIEKGKVEQVGIGVSIVDDAIAQRSGVRGVAIYSVHPNSPAAAIGLAGVRRTTMGAALGDVLIEVEGQPIRNYNDLYTAFDAHRAGDKVKIAWQRDGKRMEAEVALEVVNDEE